MLRMVQTECGLLSGVPSGDPRITVFKGVPYAKPPVGQLRWCAPQPCEPWAGVRKADHFAPISVQGQPGMDRADFYTKELHPAGDDLVISEDCLYLNVWTPARAADEKLPVFFYIHGGGLLGGYSYEMEFDGEHVARKGCIMVTVGYRLGALGFFAHPDLDAEAPGASQGNFGFLDQLAGLQWVKRNIASFGGDPERITIAGQSAGAGSVTALLCSPMIRGLISGAILMSGGGPQTFGDFAITKAQAQANCEKLLAALGVKTVAEARRLPGEAICATWGSMPHLDPDFPRAPCIVMDGVFMKKHPLDVMKDDELPRVPYMFGSCHDEGKNFYLRLVPAPRTVADFEAEARQIYGAHADAFLSAAGVKTDADLVPLYQSEDYHVFFFGHMAFAKLLCEQGRPAYTYTFDHDVPGDDHAGSYHGSELWFFFDSLARCWRPFTGKHYDLARQVSSYVVNFVRSGDPNGVDCQDKPLPAWAPYTAAHRMQMRFADVPEARELPPMSRLLDLRTEKLLGRL